MLGKAIQRKNPFKKIEENKESNHEFTFTISSQREEIENLRKIITDNNYEV